MVRPAEESRPDTLRHRLTRSWLLRKWTPSQPSPTARIHRFAASELVSRCARSWVGAEHRSERSLSCVNEERRSRPARWCAWAPRRRRGPVDPGFRGRGGVGVCLPDLAARSGGGSYASPVRIVFGGADSWGARRFLARLAPCLSAGEGDGCRGHPGSSDTPQLLGVTEA